MEKFALRNFDGSLRRCFSVEKQPIDTDSTQPVSNPAHHIMIIDRSGSMYYDMQDIRQIVEKLLVVEGVLNPDLRVTLISYSGEGDCTVHFAQVPVPELSKQDGQYVKEIRSLNATGLTCISQALLRAKPFIRENEITAVTLHSDGYANDRSPSSERQAIQNAVNILQGIPGVFVNTIAYRLSSDFTMLNSISSALGGKCVQATDTKQVYDALQETIKTLQNVAPPVEIPLQGAEYLLFVSPSNKKILGSAESMQIRGITPGSDAYALRFRPMTEAEYQTSTYPECPPTVYYAYGRAMLSTNLNASKYALVSSRNGELLKNHARALVSSDVASFALALEEALWANTPATQETYGFGKLGPSLPTVLGILNTYRDSVSVVLPENYKRRSLRRVAGVRQPDGTLQEPAVKLKSDGQEWKLSGFDFNRANATINMRLATKASLYEGETKLTKVAGISLDLSDYRQFTIVGDGQLNVTTLTVQISDKRAFTALKGIGAVSGKFDANASLCLDLTSFPVVDYAQTFSGVNVSTVNKVYQLTALDKILSGVISAESESLSDDQIVELKKYHLTPSLYFSPPTTTEYTDLAEARNKGVVDSYVAYSVTVGTPEITSLGKLKSGNEYLQRRFTAKRNGTPIAKPTLKDVLDNTVTWEVKELSARTKLDAVDELSYPIYAALILQQNKTEVKKLLTETGLADVDVYRVFEAFSNTMEKDGKISVLTKASRKVSAYLESYYRETLIPLVFYVGATGLIPESLNGLPLTAEELGQKFSSCKLSKAEAEEGSFTLLPNGVLLTVTAESKDYSVIR